MTYTEEQRAIITRMGEVSRRIDETDEAHKAAQAAANRNAIDLVARLITATEQAKEMGKLTKQHGDLFREFLDTL